MAVIEVDASLNEGVLSQLGACQGVLAAKQIQL